MYLTHQWFEEIKNLRVDGYVNYDKECLLVELPVRRYCLTSGFEQPKQLQRAVNGGICGKWKNIISLSITGGTIIGRNKSRTVIDFHHSYRDKGRVAMQWWKWRGEGTI